MSVIIPDGIICNASSINASISENGTGTYPPTPIGGTPVPTTCLYGAAIAERVGAGAALPMVLVNPAGPFVGVPGIPKTIVPPAPLVLPRTNVVPKQNTGVYINGVLVPVNGDLIAGPGATPTNLPLTGASLYPTILIGTNIPVTPEE